MGQSAPSQEGRRPEAGGERVPPRRLRSWEAPDLLEMTFLYLEMYCRQGVVFHDFMAVINEIYTT